MRIQVLGSGCKKCNELYDRAQEAAARFDGAPHGVEKIEDVDTFIRLGVMVTPALALDDEVVSTGKVLSAEEIERLVRERQG